MSATFEPRLPFDDDVDAGRSATASAEREVPLKPGTTYGDDAVDSDARRTAIDPTRNVVLEASAGTGKTRVLVERYVNLLRAGVEPDHILAITFTRKAAAEMRQRIIDRLKEASRSSEFDAARWRDLQDRLGDIAISTIDAFCLSLLREFPLEADVDPGFDLAAETDVPRLVDESLDAALRICRAVAHEDDDVALVFAQLGERRLRVGLGALLDRRLVAPQALRRYLARGPRDLTAAAACRSAARRLRDVLVSARDGLDVFLNDGPTGHPQFAMLASEIRRLAASDPSTVWLAGGGNDPTRPEQAAFRAFVDRLRGYFLTQDGKPRGDRFAGTGFGGADCRTEDAWKRHRQTAAGLAPAIADVIRGFRRDLNVIMSRGVWRIFAVALQQYQRTLDAHALVDFSGVLDRAIRLLRNLDEFSESRLRLESRYRHVLVDELQDTSRAQWELVLELVRSWGEGFGASSDALAPSIFVVGDRKQSIYGFRDADVSVVDAAADFIAGLRGDGRARQAITVSFRSAPGILAFVNDVFGGMERVDRPDAFRYDERDRFPVPIAIERSAPALADGYGKSAEARYASEGRGLSAERLDRDGTTNTYDGVSIIVGDTVRTAADRVADEVVHLLTDGTVRDRATGLARAARPADVAVLFRSRDSHRDFEAALDRRGVPTYVYKGLGFFDADEVQDAVALLRYLADPLSEPRAAALLRSRIVRLSDEGVARLSGSLANALLAPVAPSETESLGEEDRAVLDLVRRAVPGWLAAVDRVTPSHLLDAVLRETAYAYELRGLRRLQARENLKKLRAMVRRAQNRGYATVSRIAEHLQRLAVGDESNAAIDAVDAVSLMTVHAAKGLEFPIVFVVNMGRGTGGVRAPIRVAQIGGEASVAIADYQSEADEDAAARDREESKRLLYVALTRARDRLYLSATVQDGRCRTGRGSLGEVLPDWAKALFVDQAGRMAASEPQHLARPPAERERVDDFGPIG
jgi:ATP-dependent helicase/nuclease subunit A